MVGRRVPGVSPVSGGAHDELGHAMVVDELDQAPRGVVPRHDDLARVDLLRSNATVQLSVSAVVGIKMRIA